MSKHLPSDSPLPPSNENNGIVLDIPSLPLHTYGAMKGDLITMLKRKMDHHHAQAKVFEAAWKAALRDVEDRSTSDAKPRVHKITSPKGLEVNKTTFVRRFILANSEHGVTPTEIKKAARENGIETPTNFPYTILGKLAARGKVRKTDDRYYPIGTG
jgi:hypothetical protein